MKYRFLVGHSDDGVPKLELALHRLEPDEVLREYQFVDHPFSFFFDQKIGVKATVAHQPGDEGLEITVDLNGSQREADDLVRDFLISWNKMTPGLAVVLQRRLPASKA